MGCTYLFFGDRFVLGRLQRYKSFVWHSYRLVPKKADGFPLLMRQVLDNCYTTVTTKQCGGGRRVGWVFSCVMRLFVLVWCCSDSVLWLFWLVAQLKLVGGCWWLVAVNVCSCSEGRTGQVSFGREYLEVKVPTYLPLPRDT